MSDRHRILLVTDAYPPMIGGADRAARFLALELVARGHAAAVATAWQRGLPAYELRDGIEVHRLRDATSRVPFVSADPYKHIPPPFPDPEGTLRFRRLLRRWQPDLVHSYGWITYSCALAMTGTGIPLILSARDFGNFCATRGMLRLGTENCSGPGLAKCLHCAAHHYGALKGTVAVAGVLGARRPLARRLSGAHFASTYAQRIGWRHLLAGRARFARGSDVDAVSPSFRDDSYDEPPDPEILARLPEEPYILYVGAFRRSKGLDDLLQAYARLGERPPPLVLIGTPEADSPEPFPEGVTTLYSVPHGTVMAAWERALIGVLPSRMAETFGQVLHEAMSCGKATIATAHGGPLDMIVDGQSGLLVPPSDVDALTAAMRTLIDDPGLRERLGSAARERSLLFGAEHAVARLESLYAAALAPAGRRR